MAILQLFNFPECMLIMMASVLLIMPSDAMSVSIDEKIINGSIGKTAFDFFQLSYNGTIEIKVEFDMMLTIDQYKAFHTKAKYRKRAIKNIQEAIPLWPSRKVDYEISITASKYESVILQAIEHWQKYTCITFVANKSSSTRVQFIDGDSCWSNIGFLNGTNKISLNSECLTVGTVIHEIGHTIGFVHEHMRSDRNKYIGINFLGITNKYRRQFREYHAAFETYGISYDYTSVMHYNGLGHILTIDPAYHDIIGYSYSLSFKDIKRANIMYKCPTDAEECPAITCPYNGFVFFKPMDGKPKCECWCDTGKVQSPLAHCSSVSATVAEPNIEQKNNLGNMNMTICADVRTNCDFLQKKGMCITDMNMMLTDCLKTCDYCGQSTYQCLDLEDTCKFVAGSGMCKDIEMKDTLISLCATSCGMCSSGSSSCDIERYMESRHTMSRTIIMKSDSVTVFLVPVCILYMFMY